MSFLVLCIYRWIVVLGVEFYFGTIGHCYAGTGGFSVLSFPALSIIISIVSMVGSLGATLGGVTFPVPHMFAPVYYASYLFPVRHFVEIGQNLLYGNYGYAYMWGNAACLLLFLIPPLLLLPHLKRSLISRKYDDIE